MERKLASVQRIKSLDPIEGADRIEKATILGWECVVKKGEFRTGELCVYIEVDSQLPEKPEFEFLRDRKFRIRTIKLKKQISQGLVLPTSMLPKGYYKEGQDVSAIIGVTKYDPQAEQEQKLIEQKLQRSSNRITRFLSRYSWFRSLFFKPKKARFPEFIKKTDEVRLQNIPNILQQEKDTLFSCTEKIDGCSSTYYLIKNPKKLFRDKYIFGVCSRNLELPKEDNSSYWTVARQFEIKKVLKSIIGEKKFVVLQGEILGEGIQGNKYKIKDYDFYAYNLIYPDRQVDTTSMTKILEEYNIKSVKILDTEFKLKDTVPEMVEYAKGKSLLMPSIDREGVVIRNYEKGISFKVINPDFLLKNKE